MEIIKNDIGLITAFKLEAIPVDDRVPAEEKVIYPHEINNFSELTTKIFYTLDKCNTNLKHKVILVRTQLNLFN